MEDLIRSDEFLSPTTVEKKIQQLKTLQAIFGDNWEATLTQPNLVKRLQAFFTAADFQPATRGSYLANVSYLMRRTGLHRQPEVNPIYIKLQQELRRARSAVETKDYGLRNPTFHLQAVLSNARCPPSVVTVAILMLYESITLRPQEYVNTLVGHSGAGDDGEHNYLDLDTGEWQIHGPKHQDLSISLQTCKLLESRNVAWKDGSYLVSGRHGDAFNSSSALSTLFKNHVGFPMTAFRQAVSRVTQVPQSPPISEDSEIEVIEEEIEVEDS